MKNRSKLFSHFRAFCAKIQTQFHVYVPSLRSNNVKEYHSEQFQSFKLQKGILHQTYFFDTPLRMVLLRGRIDTSLKLPELYYSKCMCLSISEPMMFPLLVFLLIGCLT